MSQFIPKCRKCGADLRLDSMHALPDGGGFVCKTCPRDTAASPIPAFLSRHKRFASGDAPPTSSRYDTEPIDTSTGFFANKTYRCNYCRFKFSKKAEAYVRVCPNCGREELDQEFESYTDQLLRE